MAGDLNSRIGFVQAAKALNIRLTSHSLPSQGNCPVCQTGRITLYQDTNLGGRWAHCRSCEFTGDFVDLGKQVWKCNTSVAISEFQNHEALPISPKINELAAQWEKQSQLNKGIRELMLKAFRGGRIVNDSGARHMLGMAGIKMEAAMSWSVNGFGKLLGFASSTDIEDAFRPRRMTSPKRNVPRPQQITPTSVDACFIIPFYDVPGRVASASFVVTEAKTDCRYVDHYVRLPGATRPCSGIAFHPDTFHKSDDSRLLLTSDTDTYLRMHMRNFCQAPKTLPLVCYREGANPTDNWQMFGRRQFVFWGQTITPHLLWISINNEARISTYGPAGRTMKEFLKAKSAAGIVDKCFEKAKPWPSALAALVESKNPYDLADFLGQMSLRDTERDRVINACDKRLRDKLKLAFSKSVEYRTVPVNDGYIEQRASGWYYVRPGRGEQMVTNAPFKVTEAIHSTTGIDYNVEAVVNGRPFSFQVPKETFAKQTLDVVHDKAIEMGCGVPTFDPAWQRQALHIAKQMHEPVARRKAERIGYSAADDAFILPYLRVDAINGSVSGDVTGDDNQPGANIRGTHYDTDAIHKLLDNPDAITPMSVFLGSLGQIMCDVTGRPPMTVGLMGTSARRAAVHVAEAIGFATSSSLNSKALVAQSSSHAWPFAVGIRQQLPSAERKYLLEHAAHHQLVMPVNETQMIYGQLAGTMSTVQSAGYLGLPSEQLEVLGPLFVRVISHMCKYNLQGLVDNALGPTFGAYRLLCKYLKHECIPHSILSTAVKRCPPSHNASDQFARAVATFISRGKLTIGHSSDDIQNGCVVPYTERKAVAVPLNAFMRCLKDGFAPEIDRDDLLLRLTNSPVPCGTEYRGRDFIVVLNERQYSSQKMAVSLQQTKLKIVSA